MTDKGSMSVREAGRKGGRMTKARHGPEFFERIGHKGGETTKLRHGQEFFERIGHKGGQRLRLLLSRGKGSMRKAA